MSKEIGLLFVLAIVAGLGVAMALVKAEEKTLTTVTDPLDTNINIVIATSGQPQIPSAYDDYIEEALTHQDPKRDAFEESQRDVTIFTDETKKDNTYKDAVNDVISGVDTGDSLGVLDYSTYVDESERNKAVPTDDDDKQQDVGFGYIPPMTTKGTIDLDNVMPKPEPEIVSPILYGTRKYSVR